MTHKATGYRCFCCNKNYMLIKTLWRDPAKKRHIHFFVIFTCIVLIKTAHEKIYRGIIQMLKYLKIFFFKALNPFRDESKSRLKMFLSIFIFSTLAEFLSYISADTFFFGFHAGNNLLFVCSLKTQTIKVFII